MAPSLVDDPLVVDKYKQVVIAAERKLLPPLVAEGSVNLRGEGEVVILAFVAKALIIEGKER